MINSFAEISSHFLKFVINLSFFERSHFIQCSDIHYHNQILLLLLEVCFLNTKSKFVSWKTKGGVKLIQFTRRQRKDDTFSHEIGKHSKNMKNLKVSVGQVEVELAGGTRMCVCVHACVCACLPACLPACLSVWIHRLCNKEWKVNKHVHFKISRW